MHKKTNSFHDQVAIQSWLSPAITPVPANVDYQRFEQEIEHINAVLRSSGIERQAIDLALERFPGQNPADRNRHAEFAIESLRIGIVRHLLGNPSYRELARQLCMSNLLADFCGLNRIDGIRRATKSTLERRSKEFTEEQLRGLLCTLTEVIGNRDLCSLIKLKEPEDMSVCLMDSTCLEANIHHPVDWVLLRDVSRTLIKALKKIRGAGILCRMPAGPEELASWMNRLCMQMTHSRRKPQAEKKRKKILRQMKRLLRTIERHALRHADRLTENYERTRFSQVQASNIALRIQEQSGKVAAVIRQAHERIIGGRKVSSKEKILSVYQQDIHVIVRGKAGREVEFGNTLLISETQNGYISDWKLYKDSAPPEWQQLHESIERQNQYDLDQPIVAVCTDRGFANKSQSTRLNQQGIFDATCPRNPSLLQEKMKNERFRQLQWRRGSTEARLSALKNRWLGTRVLGKSYHSRNLAVGWAVLSHDLWFIARELSRQKGKDPPAVAA